MARLNVIIKRNTNNSKIIPEQTELIFKSLRIDILGRTVYIDNREIPLTPKEYDLLLYLVENKNIALTREQLLDAVWGYDFFGEDRTVDTHIKMLRNNLKRYRKNIMTLRSVGYKFEWKEK